MNHKSTTTVLLQQEQFKAASDNASKLNKSAEFDFEKAKRSLKETITENRDTLVIHDIECN